MRYVTFLLVSFFILTGCGTRNVFNDPIPDHKTIKLDSKYVNETRVINIWTPSKYTEDGTKFPVLYMPDGGIDEDFPHIANTLAKLIKENKIEPIILVGIKNTLRGRDLTGASTVKEHEKYEIPMDDGAKNFRAFITEELIPEINATYRTSSKKGIIGESLAGLFVMETFFLKPETFDFYIAIDPSLWWNNNALVDEAETYFETLPKRETKLWFTASDAVDIYRYTEELKLKLETIEPANLLWKYSPEPNEHHNTIFRATKENALIWSLGKSEYVLKLKQSLNGLSLKTTSA